MSISVISGVRCSIMLLLVVGLLFGCGSPVPDIASVNLDKALLSGKPTLAEFGSNHCIPCKSMRPILEQLAVDYDGRLNVLVVEVSSNEKLADRYGIRVIPVQIFFDGTGKEVARHMGFMPRAEIIAQLRAVAIH